MGYKIQLVHGTKQKQELKTSDWVIFCFRGHEKLEFGSMSFGTHLVLNCVQMSHCVSADRAVIKLQSGSVKNGLTFCRDTSRTVVAV